MAEKKQFSPSADTTGVYEQVIKYTVMNASKDQQAAAIQLRKIVADMHKERLDSGKSVDEMQRALRDPQWLSDLHIAVHSSDALQAALINALHLREVESLLNEFNDRIRREAPDPDTAALEITNMFRWCGLPDVVGESGLDSEVASIRAATIGNAKPAAKTAAKTKATK